MRSLAEKFGCRREVIKRILDEMGFNKKKRTEKPKVSPSQAIRQEERLARALDPRRGSLRPRRGWCIVMDDESYFGLSRHSTSSFYYQGNKEVPTNIKFKEKTKFESKLMVWAAVSSRGISHFAIFEEKTFMNTTLYIAVIATHLLPFIEKHHGDGKYIFWPDLAPCHYAKETLAKMAELGIRFVPKKENPPAAPEVRPV